MKASRETVKMKTSEGEVKTAVLGDNPGAEEYLQHIAYTACFLPTVKCFNRVSPNKVEDGVIRFDCNRVTKHAL